MRDDSTIEMTVQSSIAYGRVGIQLQSTAELCLESSYNRTDDFFGIYERNAR